jgi:hypothetical protein
VSPARSQPSCLHDGERRGPAWAARAAAGERGLDISPGLGKPGVLADCGVAEPGVLADRSAAYPGPFPGC